MTYTIKEVAKIFNLSTYTLRYYDKEGLLPFVSKNESGYREFTEADLGLIHTICCLKNTGMPIKDIRTYITYCMEGPDTIPLRKELLLAHKKNVLENLEKIQENLKGIDQKLTTYSSPDAKEIITKQWQFSSWEKEQHDLENPYKQYLP
ncbi:MAG: MerR family transcriptional regulator [Enterococcus sp.]